MTIVVTGGGSGGHTTPLLAVVAEIKRLRPNTKIIYIGQRGDSFGDMPSLSPNIDETYMIHAGKFRRYHGEGIKQIFDLKTFAQNVRDTVKVAAGIWQSYWLLGKLKPNTIFIKGGFVGVPVGLAAAMRRVSFITHDSDAIPGLANRIIGRWAKLHAVALPKETYTYPPDKTVQVGVPVQGSYSLVNKKQQKDFRHKIGLGEYQKILLITGGSLGAQRVNKAVLKMLPALLKEFPDLAVVHIAGQANKVALQEQYGEVLSEKAQGRVVVKGFVEDFYNYSAAADIIIARAGATSLAEFALQGKACILIPSPNLTGGHQLKNAEYLAKQSAVEIVKEADIAKDSQVLARSVEDLLNDEAKRRILAENLTKFAAPHAARRLAMLLLDS